MILKVPCLLALIILVTVAFMNGCSDSEDTEGDKITRTSVPTLAQSPTPTLPVTPPISPTVKPPTTAPNSSPTQPTSAANPVVVIRTNFGDMIIELYQGKLPITAENFLKYVDDGFYEDIIFHRVSDNFMIQAGMQTADGNIKVPTYKPINLETHPDVTHVDGAISMARTADPNSATAQFFICDGPQHLLDKNYAAFGVVIDGIEVVREIAAAPNDGRFEPNPGGGQPLEKIIIESITVQ